MKMMVVAVAVESGSVCSLVLGCVKQAIRKVKTSSQQKSAVSNNQSAVIVIVLSPPPSPFLYQMPSAKVSAVTPAKRKKDGVARPLNQAFAIKKTTRTKVATLLSAKARR